MGKAGVESDLMDEVRAESMNPSNLIGEIRVECVDPIQEGKVSPSGLQRG